MSCPTSLIISIRCANSLSENRYISVGIYKFAGSANVPKILYNYSPARQGELCGISYNNDEKLTLEIKSKHDGKSEKSLNEVCAFSILASVSSPEARSEAYFLSFEGVKVLDI